MHEDIRRILLDRYTLQARVYQMAQQIAADFADREFLLMPLLTGSIIFVADLVRHLPVRMRIDVLAVSSYPGRATASQGPRILYPAAFDVRGKHVLVIDELGYQSYAADAANVLFRVVSIRHLRRRPILVTTNKPLAALGQVLHDADLAEAILDRLLERGTHYVLRGRSYRTRHQKEEPPSLSEDAA